MLITIKENIATISKSKSSELLDYDTLSTCDTIILKNIKVIDLDKLPKNIKSFTIENMFCDEKFTVKLYNFLEETTITDLSFLYNSDRITPSQSFHHLPPNLKSLKLYTHRPSFSGDLFSHNIVDTSINNQLEQYEGNCSFKNYRYLIENLNSTKFKKISLLISGHDDEQLIELIKQIRTNKTIQEFTILASDMVFNSDLRREINLLQTNPYLKSFMFCFYWKKIENKDVNSNDVKIKTLFLIERDLLCNDLLSILFNMLF
jgi:hypothetical protein